MYCNYNYIKQMLMMLNMKIMVWNKFGFVWDVN